MSYQKGALVISVIVCTILVLCLAALVPISASALSLSMVPTPLQVGMNYGYPVDQGGGSMMDVSLLAGDSDTNTVFLLFSNLTGPADDLLGIGFYSIAPGVGHQILMSNVDLIVSSFDTFTPLTDWWTTGSDNFLLRVYDMDGVGGAVLRIQMEETPRSIFIVNTGSYHSYSVFVAAINPTNPVPVPEPSSVLLFGAGLAGVGIMRKRFKK